jgi:glycosyltransferase involved in cell wall biosynthesis
MRLLYIITNVGGAGGMERILLLKAGYLAQHYGYDIDILVTNPTEEPVHYDVHPAITFRELYPTKDNGITYFKTYTRLLKRAVRHIAPHVIVMCDNGLKSFLLPFIIKDIPLVYECHVARSIALKPQNDTFFTRLKNKGFRAYTTASAKRFDAFVSLTQSGAAEWPAKGLLVIPNPLWFETVAASSLKNMRAVAIGRHAYEKGYDRLFEVWKKVLQKHPDWQLDIYGDDNPEYDIRRMAKEQGLTTGVNFYKPVKDIVSVYQNASLCLMASRYEGFGMVLLEAMACGVPCVAFDCPVGPGEIINADTSGFLIQDGNTEAFAAAVSRLISDEQLRVTTGANAKIRAEEFDLAHIMQQWDVLFKGLRKRA